MTEALNAKGMAARQERAVQDLELKREVALDDLI
jgi:hypothetical protein